MANELLPSIEAIASESLDVVSTGGRVYVEGPVGAGRNSVVAKLAELEPRAAVLELLPLADADAPVVALLELAAQLDARGEALTWSSGTEEELHTLALSIGARVADAKRVLVIRMPDNWAAADAVRSSADALPSRARSLLSGLFRSPAAVVLVADAAVTPASIEFHAKRRFQLRMHLTRADALESADWTEYRDAFEEIVRASGRTSASPLAWRLAIGSRALGTPLETIREHLGSELPLPRLAATLADRLRGRGELHAAVRRFMALRRPVSRTQACELSGIPNEHRPLILECVGYGSGETRVSTVLRTILAEKLGGADEESHATFADHYGRADGAASPVGLGGAALRAWLEKTHHLAHAGASGAHAWSRLELVAPNFYWDRGRYLSQVARDYDSAAAVYSKCVERFPSDDYAWHYLAFNLQRSKQASASIVGAYHEAIRLNPEHPRWNGRLVTFLIGAGRFDEAEREWRASIERIDPDGSQVNASDWLAKNLHLWVCGAWLSAGKPDEAKRVLDLIPKRFVAHGALSVLRERIQEGDLHMRWESFLGALEQQCFLSAAHADHVRNCWKSLRRVEPALPLPIAHRTADGELQFAWSYPSLLLEFDVSPTGEVYWFARDRDSGAFEEGEATEQAIPDGLRSWLERAADA